MRILSAEERQKIKGDIKNNVLSERKLAKKYDTSKGNIARIKKQMQLEDVNIYSLEDGSNSSLLKELDSKVFETFLRLRRSGIPLNGPSIKSIALRLAKKLYMSKFKASNGWLENFKKRHILSFKNISGESRSADIKFIGEFKSNFQHKINEYGACNIFNCDETALYYKNPPVKSFVTADDDCKGQKSNKERITVMLACSMMGEKINPLVIGKYQKPRALKNFSIKDICVDYGNSAKAWMTSEIFKRFLKSLNENMISQNRRILLLLDNAPCHPEVQLSNVEIMFLPKNTTSVMQPLDMGIIKAFKDYYFNALIDSYEFRNNQQNLFKMLNIKDAIILVSIAWDNISQETIVNCFGKALVEKLKQTADKMDDNEQSVLINKVVDEVFGEANETDAEDDEKIINIVDEPRNLIKLALSHFDQFYNLVEELTPLRLKTLTLLRVDLIREWKKKYKFGSLITDFLEKQ